MFWNHLCASHTRAVYIFLSSFSWRSPRNETVLQHTLIHTQTKKGTHVYEHKAEFKNYNELAFQLQIQLFGLFIENGSEPFKYCPSANKLGEKLRQEKAQGTQQGKEGPRVPAQKSLLLLSVLFSPVSISYCRSFFSSPCNDRFSRARLLPVCKAHFWRFCLQISPVRCFCQECRFPMKFYQQLFCRLRPFDLFCNIGFSTNLSSSEE